MKNATSGNTSKAKPKTDWKRLRTMTDAQVHASVTSDPEIRPTDENFWQNAHVVLPKPKEIVTMRLDSDLLAWFRRARGYQTKINAILRAYMNAHNYHRR